MQSPFKILLIESNMGLAKTITQWFQDKVYLVHAADKKSALEQGALPDWNLIITDINSSEIDDLDIIQVIKKANPSAAILVVAENIKVDFILTAMKYHADGLFFKPLDEKEFVSRALQLAEDARKKKSQTTRVILAIGAHPDDVEFGCGGTLSKLLAEGNEINILTLSLGHYGGDPVVRKKEAYEAAKLQGANLYLGDFSDTNITNGIETIQFIEKIVQKVKPTHVYTHSISDNHQDHRSTYQSTVTACRSVANLFSYLSPSSTIDFRPNTFINIDDYMDSKLKVISAYTSQISTRPYLQPELIIATARYWGRFCNYSLVEPMEVIKEQA